MVVTEEFIRTNQTARGGWNFSQISMLGEPWPPAKGWIERAVGKEISEESAGKFIEFGKSRPGKAQRKLLKETFEKKAVKAREKKVKKAKKQESQLQMRGRFEATDGFLMTYEWRVMRMKVLKRDGAVCACCGSTPAHGARMNVDHIKPRQIFPHLAMDMSNLQVLCDACNHGKGNWDMTDWRKADESLLPEQQSHLRSILDGDTTEQRGNGNTAGLDR